MSLLATSTEITYIDNLVLEAANIVEKDEPDLSNFQDLLTTNDLITYAQWSNEKPYSRVCLFENEDFELVLICWNPDAKTAIHNHNEQNCWVFSVDADIEEVLYCKEGKAVTEINQLGKGDITFMEKGNKCHSLQNVSGERAMTLHLYNEPIRKCEVVLSQDKDCLEWAEMHYDAKV